MRSDHRRRLLDAGDDNTGLMTAWRVTVALTAEPDPHETAALERAGWTVQDGAMCTQLSARSAGDADRQAHSAVPNPLRRRLFGKVQSVRPAGEAEL